MVLQYARMLKNTLNVSKAQYADVLCYLLRLSKNLENIWVFIQQFMQYIRNYLQSAVSPLIEL